MGNEATWLRFVYVEQETRQRFAQKCMRNEIVAAKLTRTHTHVHIERETHRGAAPAVYIAWLRV